MERHTVVLAVSGSIAAYKAAQTASDLVKEGFEVRVIVTSGGGRFITPLTFKAITGHAVSSNVWNDPPVAAGMQHVDLATWAELLLVAPASADAIARLSQGRSDDLLGATALAFRGPLLIAPAMESNMFSHPATESNLRVLVERGATVVGPESGRLASGASGPGRMSEPAAIVSAVKRLLISADTLRGCKVLVTAGPTYEPIDPVRFVGNRSSGKMGYAVASEARRRGAEVVLVSGPTALAPPSGMQLVRVESSDQMREAVRTHVRSSNVVVMSAAVSDFKPPREAGEKLKRAQMQQLDLVPTVDIASEASQLAPGAVHIGFALETSRLVESAREKLRRKGLSLVVANEVTSEHDPFGSDLNQVVFVTETSERRVPLTTKAEIARLLCDEIEQLVRRREL